MDHGTLTRLWQEYFQQELGGDIGDVPSFPDWLRDGGHLQQLEEEAENRRSIVDALESAPHLAWDIVQISAKAVVPPGLTQVILGELEEEGRVTVEAGAGRPRWRARSGGNGDG